MYNHDLVLLVRGGADYRRLIPTNTRINTADFSSVPKLVEFLNTLGNDQVRYTELLKKKDMFECVYRQTYSQNLCQMCKMLNNVAQSRKTYWNVRDYLENGQCRMATDVDNPGNKQQYLNSERVFQ
ncbi:hypothetical protein DPMN_096819 [Dreissena polymorpha]|uniref:Fucosyltransferase n=1 Tax=Dreissena polymorpha TaxID=45954 RepID=A0A9D4R541_DREPO|nr:hypothetical protein DPMN_096819 [Dreissena polymorpha]